MANDAVDSSDDSVPVSEIQSVDMPKYQKKEPIKKKEPKTQTEAKSDFAQSILSEDEQMDGWDKDMKSRYLEYKSTATKAGWHVAQPTQYAAARSYAMYVKHKDMQSRAQQQRPQQQGSAGGAYSADADAVLRNIKYGN